MHTKKNWRRFLSMLCALTTAAAGMSISVISTNAAEISEQQPKEALQYNSRIHSDCRGNFPLVKLDDIPYNTYTSGRKYFNGAPSVSESVTKSSESYIPMLIIALSFNDITINDENNISKRYFAGEKSITQYYHDQSFGQLTFMPAKETSSSNSGNSTNLYDAENDGVVFVKLDMPHPDWSFGLGEGLCETDEELKEYIDNEYDSLLTTLSEAIMQADEYVDFSQYDANNNGIIENNEMALAFVVAGKDPSVVREEEFETINLNEYTWPHAENLDRVAKIYDMELTPYPDGVMVSNYIAIPEYELGDSYTWIATLAHELGHYLGLPDLYDTTYNYEGEWSGYDPYYLSIMSSGNFCIDPETDEYSPSSFDIWSKIMLGWVKPEHAAKNGTYTINATDYNNLQAGCTALIIPTQHENEYYIVENRQSEKWDASINYTWSQIANEMGFEKDYEKGGSLYQSGLILWHIDMTNYDTYWIADEEINIVNSSDHHPCVVPLYYERTNPEADDSEAIYDNYGEYPALGIAYYCKDKWEQLRAVNGETLLNLPVYGNGKEADLRSARWDSGITVKFLDSDSPSMHIEVNFDNHVHYLEHHDEIPATKDTTGMKEYWTCTLCDKYFTDENGKHEAAYEELILPATGSIITTTALQSTETTTTTTTAVNDKHIASDDKLCVWAVNDYKNKTGETDISAEITSTSDNVYEITLKDKDGNVVDVYKVDPVTGSGTNSAQKYVDLPQTGNNSLINWLWVIGAFMLIGGGIFTVKSSCFIRRKENEQ